jgi:tetratricopeptide (TPR) repeat protein
VLLACISASAAAGLDRHTWQLAWTMKTYLFRGGHWHELLATQTAAVEAARRNGDLSGLAPSLVNLAETEMRLNRLGKAEARYREALALYTAAGNLTRAADVWIGLSALAGEQNRCADALGFSRQALVTSQRAGDRSGQALALNSIGWDHSTLGEYNQAVASCQEALVLMRELGLREGEACTWDTMGSALHGLADYPQAAECYQRALGLFRQLGDRYHEAGALTSLGEVHVSAGDHGAARRAWAGAVRILEEIGHADASRVRAKLAALLSPGTQPAVVIAD